MRYSALALAVFALGSSPATATSFDSGNDLYRYCSSKDAGKTILCLGLVTGYLEGMQLAFDCNNLDAVSREQLKDIVLKFLHDNPADRHLPAALLSSRAYYLAFKCQKASQ
jgi:hypothetical protein